MQYVETPIEDATKIIQSVTCPDHKTTCRDGTTCCINHDKSYGCCPYHEGVCCKDEVSCCPQATTCCGNGCCPLTNAVCCKDGIGCCPYGTQCPAVIGGDCIEPHFLPILMGLPKFIDIDPPIEKVSTFFMS